MGKVAFKAVATTYRPWWFTHAEVQHLDTARAFRSASDHMWEMKDATFSPEIDAIRVSCKDHHICLSKRMDMATWTPVYNIAVRGEKPRTFKSFAELEMVMARTLQLHSGPDLLWARIEAAIKTDKLTPQ